MKGCFVFIILCLSVLFLFLSIERHPEILGHKQSLPSASNNTPQKNPVQSTVPKGSTHSLTPDKNRDVHQAHDGLFRMYNVTAFQSSPKSESDIKILRKRSQNLLSEKGIQKVHTHSSNAEISLEALDWAQLEAMILMLEFGHSGLEADIVVTHRQGNKYLVSVYWEPNNSVFVSNQIMRNRPQLQSVSKAELQKKYMLSSIEDVDTRWTRDELGVIAYCLSILSDEERILLEGTRLLRKKKSKEQRRHGNWTQAGLFEQQNDKKIITLFDHMFAYEGSNFVGSIDVPHRSSTFTLLHEIGHLIHSYPSVEYIRQQNQLVRDMNGLIEKYNSNPTQNLNKVIEAKREKLRLLESKVPTDNGPVLEMFQRQRMFQKGPTTYSNVSLEEAFAESFAMYRLDPEALRRVDPNSFNWFSSNGHIQALSD